MVPLLAVETQQGGRERLAIEEPKLPRGIEFHARNQLIFAVVVGRGGADGRVAVVIKSLQTAVLKLVKTVACAGKEMVFVARVDVDGTHILIMQMG